MVPNCALWLQGMPPNFQVYWNKLVLWLGPVSHSEHTELAFFYGRGSVDYFVTYMWNYASVIQ